MFMIEMILEVEMWSCFYINACTVMSQYFSQIIFSYRNLHESITLHTTA